LDFEKALFDNMKHKAILAVLQGLGFGPTWLNWMQANMGTSTSSVLLNECQVKPSTVKEV